MNFRICEKEIIKNENETSASPPPPPPTETKRPKRRAKKPDWYKAAP